MPTLTKANERGPEPTAPADFVRLVRATLDARMRFISEAENEISSYLVGSAYFKLLHELDNQTNDLLSILAQWQQSAENLPD